MDQFSPKIVGFSITRGSPDGRRCCYMFIKILSGSSGPKRLSTDNDPLFEFYQWQANLRVSGIDEIKSVPHIPWSHPFIERLIGTIRREYLDQVFFWNEADLVRKLNEYVEYYNEHRVHYAFADGSVPEEMDSMKKRIEKGNGDSVKWKSHCRGLFTVPLAA